MSCYVGEDRKVADNDVEMVWGSFGNAKMAQSGWKRVNQDGRGVVNGIDLVDIRGRENYYKESAVMADSNVFGPSF